MQICLGLKSTVTYFSLERVFFPACEMQGKFIMKPGPMTYSEEKLLIFFGQVVTFTLVLNFIVILFFIMGGSCCECSEIGLLNWN